MARGRRKLGLEKPASTAAVRTHWKMRVSALPASTRIFVFWDSPNYNELFVLPVFAKLFSNLKDTQLRVTEGNAKMKLNHKINGYDHLAGGGQ